MEVDTCPICYEKLHANMKAIPMTCPLKHKSNTCEPANQSFPDVDPLPGEELIAACWWDDVVIRLHDLVWRDEAISENSGDDLQMQHRRVTVQLPCGHIMHAACLLEYIRMKKNECPYRCGPMVKCTLPKHPSAMSASEVSNAVDQVIGFGASASDIASLLAAVERTSVGMTAVDVITTIHALNRNYGVRVDGSVLASLLRAVERTAIHLTADRASEMIDALCDLDAPVEGSLRVSLLAAVERTLTDMTADEVVYTIEGIERIGAHCEDTLLASLFTAVERTSIDFTAEDVASVTYSFGLLLNKHLESHVDWQLTRLFAAMERTSVEMTADDVTNTLFGMGEMGLRMEGTSSDEATTIKGYPQWSIGHGVWGKGRVRVERPLLASLLTAVERTSISMTGNNTAKTVWGLGMLGAHVEGSLLASLLTAMERTSIHMRVIEVVTLIEGLWLMNVHVEGPPLTSLLSAVERTSIDMDILNVMLTIDGLCRMRGDPRRLDVRGVCVDAPTFASLLAAVERTSDDMTFHIRARVLEQLYTLDCRLRSPQEGGRRGRSWSFMTSMLGMSVVCCAAMLQR